MKEFIKALDTIEEWFVRSVLAFWLLETIYFIIAYSWHWKAINANEKYCDALVNSGINIWWILFFTIILIKVIYLIYHLITDIKNDLNI